MRSALPLLAFTASLLCAPVAMALNEYGIEGMGVVSTRADEGRASVAADGQSIVWASTREGADKGWNLWQARLIDGRWQQPQPLPLNSSGDDIDPYFSHDGRWLLFASDRDGAMALYRVPVSTEGALGEPERLPAAGTTRNAVSERAPALSRNGRWLLSVRAPGRGQPAQLWVSALQGARRGLAQPLSALGGDDGVDGADWLGNDGAVVFTRGTAGQRQLWTSACAWSGEATQPLALSFNTAQGRTLAPVVDAAKPSELLLVSSSARAPRAGGLDVYRMLAPQPRAAQPCRPG
ncbi:hypothetical protein RZA67_15135 [Stenotrophomonas sp. C3(2023)]|uniref:hypothetical protein n=1 Tax=Stenotrophomonas sp. C3(2023) TaxID=3080277 RepID=UPI00293C8478|nr:hypothetical protein [Stenotrophomonas sp. C3(2023)]MDV3470055.1 hypothetical protein [Stenotrophomonas sp. C3(2023)]